MQDPVEIENIYELRRRQGITDVELRQKIRKLKVGDSVKLTFLTAMQMFSGESLLVRITSITAQALRGKLAHRPTFIGLSKLRVGSRITFTTEHIHSIPKERPRHDS